MLSPSITFSQSNLSAIPFSNAAICSYFMGRNVPNSKPNFSCSVPILEGIVRYWTLIWWRLQITVEQVQKQPEKHTHLDNPITEAGIKKLNQGANKGIIISQKWASNKTIKGIEDYSL